MSRYDLDPPAIKSPPTTQTNEPAEYSAAITQQPNLHVATGHAMMGFALGPITGKLITQLLLDNDNNKNNKTEPTIDITALTPNRF